MIRANRSERRGDQKARASLDDASCRVSGVAGSFNNVAGSTHKESKWVRQWLIVAGRTGAGFPAADSDGYWVPRSWECGGWCRYVLRTTYDTLAISLLSLSVCFTLSLDLNWWMTQRILLFKETFSHTTSKRYRPTRFLSNFCDIFILKLQQSVSHPYIRRKSIRSWSQVWRRKNIGCCSLIL